MFRIVVLAFCCGFVLSSCKKEENEQKIIINGILTVNQPPRIKICILFKSDSPYEWPVSDAIVSIENNGETYLLDEVENKVGIYTDKSRKLEILANESYKLRIEYGDIQAYAETIVPEKPVGLVANFEYIEIPSESGFSLLINWKKQTAYSFVTINSISEEVNEAIDLSQNSADYVPFYLNRPYQLETVVLSLSDFKYYGTNIIKVYSIHEEYQELYTYQKEYKVDNPPIGTNITNGLGIFTGINYDSLVIEVINPLDAN